MDFAGLVFVCLQCVYGWVPSLYIQCNLYFNSVCTDEFLPFILSVICMFTVCVLMSWWTLMDWYLYVYSVCTDEFLPFIFSVICILTVCVPMSWWTLMDWYRLRPLWGRLLSLSWIRMLMSSGVFLDWLSSINTRVADRWELICDVKENSTRHILVCNNHEHLMLWVNNWKFTHTSILQGLLLYPPPRRSWGGI